MKNNRNFYLALLGSFAGVFLGIHTEGYSMEGDEEFVKDSKASLIPVLEQSEAATEVQLHSSSHVAESDKAANFPRREYNARQAFRIYKPGYAHGPHHPHVRH